MVQATPRPHSRAGQRPAAALPARRQGSSVPARASIAPTPPQGQWVHSPASVAGVDHTGCARRASGAGLQALSNNLVSGEQRCLTLAFSGAVNGIERMMRNLLHGLRCNALLGVSGREDCSSVMPSQSINMFSRYGFDIRLIFSSLSGFSL
jgi:hypothetical protein